MEIVLLAELNAETNARLVRLRPVRRSDKAWALEACDDLQTSN
jgi:hypothetical protein